MPAAAAQRAPIDLDAHRGETIYALIDPRQQEVVYVGRTSQSVYSRLRQHMNEAVNAVHSTANPAKTAWLRALLADGLLPSFVELETVPTEDAERVETAYIMTYQEAGVSLFNAAGIAAAPRFNEAPNDKDRYTMNGRVGHATYLLIHEAARARRMTVAAFISELIENAMSAFSGERGE